MFLSEWREFPSAPCLAGKRNWWQLASRCCWNCARPWHASELVSVLVGLRTYQHSGNVEFVRGRCYWCGSVCSVRQYIYIYIYIYISQSEVDWSVCLWRVLQWLTLCETPHCQLQAHDEIFGRRSGTSVLKMVSASCAGTVVHVFRTFGWLHFWTAVIL